MIVEIGVVSVTSGRFVLMSGAMQYGYSAILSNELTWVQLGQLISVVSLCLALCLSFDVSLMMLGDSFILFLVVLSIGISLAEASPGCFQQLCPVGVRD